MAGIRIGYVGYHGSLPEGEVVKVSVCRISLQPAGRGDSVDLLVCARTPVGVLLPALVDHIGHPPQTVARSWRLDRLVGEPLNGSLSLRDNAISDGETLVLTDARAPKLGPMGRSPERVAAAGSAVDSTWPLRQVASACAAMTSVILLLCNGSHIAVILAAVGTCAVSGCGLATRSIILAVVGCAMAATAGFVAVPSGALTANAFLASCAAFAVAAVLATLWRQPCATLTAVICLAGLSSCSTGIAMFAPLTAPAVGVLLVLAALAVLTGAPKLSAAIALQRRAEAAHVVLTGLVTGSAAGSAAGVATVALQCGLGASNPLAGSAFGAAVGLCLLTRMRTYVDGPRRWALLAGGVVALVSAVAVIGVAYPDYSAWSVPAVLTVGLVSLRETWPALATRGADLLDYAALAAVPPAACWVMGVYGAARGWMP